MTGAAFAAMPRVFGIGNGRAPMVRLFSSAVASQALTSAASFLVGLILIRHESPAQYGYYVLVLATLLLLMGMQFAYLGPSLVVRLAALDLAGRRDLVGGMLREQRRATALAGSAAALVAAVLWKTGLLADRTVLLVGAAILAAEATLQREFFRMVLQAYRRPLDVLRTDAVYVVLLVGGAAAATLAPVPAAAAVASLACASAVGAVLLARRLRQYEGWNPAGAPGILAEVAPIGAWAVFGAAVHWAFNQGYTYVVGGTLDVEAVAALAATRLLLMPINLLSQGTAQVLLPTTSRWLQQHAPAVVLRRLIQVCGALAALALCYCGGIWLLRGWIFGDLMRRPVEHGDALLLMWCAIFLLMVLRDQIAHLLVARGRLRQLSTVTCAAAIVALAVIYQATLHLGAFGALVGVFLGEFLNLVGVIALSAREATREATRETAPEAAREGASIQSPLEQVK